MITMLDAVVSWPTLLLVLLVFGFAPGAVLRLIVLAYPKGDPRRDELLAEVYAVPRVERPLWVAQQLEVAIFEGLMDRLVWAATGRVIHRWHLVSGVDQNRRYPESFFIPSEDERRSVQPGDVVKIYFSMKDGWAERMWVEVRAVKRRHIVGTLNNQPIGIPRLCSGDKVRFRPEHIIDMCPDGISEDRGVDGIRGVCERCCKPGSDPVDVVEVTPGRRGRGHAGS